MFETLNEALKDLNASLKNLNATISDSRFKYHPDKFKSAGTASKAEALRQLVQFYFGLEEIFNTATSVACQAKKLTKPEETDILVAPFFHFSTSLHGCLPWMCGYIFFLQMELEKDNLPSIAQLDKTRILNDHKKSTNYYKIKQARFQPDEIKKYSVQVNTLEKKIIEVHRNIYQKQEVSESGNITSSKNSNKNKYEVHVLLAKYAVLKISKRIKQDAKNLKRDNRETKIEMKKLKQRNTKLSSKIDQLEKEVEKNKKTEEELKNAKEPINQLSYIKKMLERENELLVEKFLTQCSNTKKSAQSSQPQSGDCKVHKKVRELRKIKAAFPKESILRKAKEIFKRYNEMTENEKDDAAFDIALEEIDLERSIKLYLDTIDINLLTLSCTRDITKLHPLPELPSLFNEFMNAYRSVLTKYSQEKKRHDVSKFCYFCHRQLEGLLVTCKYCKKSFHKNCVNKECGWCDAEMDIPKTSN